MNTKPIVCGLIIASLGLSSLSFAQPARRDERELRHDRREIRQDRRELQRDRRDAREERREDRREERQYYNAHEFGRGQRLPPGLRDRQYVVSDWRRHHLAPPPRGYQWVQVGPDYVLAAIATGVILNLILNQ